VRFDPAEQWEGGSTHTGPAFSDLPVGSLPANSGVKMHFTGVSILKVANGLIVEEKGSTMASRCSSRRA
jgi:hypothetical protein